MCVLAYAFILYELISVKSENSIFCEMSNNIVKVSVVIWHRGVCYRMNISNENNNNNQSGIECVRFAFVLLFSHSLDLLINYFSVNRIFFCSLYLSLRNSTIGQCEFNRLLKSNRLLN